MQNKHRKLEQAATEQLNARRGADRALVEAQTRITQLDQALQQGGRPGTAAGQVVDTRVLGRPDKWDGSEKAWPNWSFVMKTYAGAIDEDLSADMTAAECSTDAMSNDTMTGERKARSVHLYFVLIMLCTGRALDRIANAPHGWCMEAWRMLFEAYSPKNNVRLVVMMLEVLALMDVDAFTKGSKGASKGSGKVVCWYREKKSSSFRLSQEAKGQRQWKVERFQERRQQRKSNKEKFKGKCYKCGKTGHMSKGCRSKETSAFEAGEELAETGCVEMASVDLNALEIGAVQLPERDHRIRIGIDSCAAVTVFPKSVADDYPMLDTPGKAKSYRPASGKLLPDLGARKVQVKLRDGSLRYVNPRVADTHRALMAVSEMNDIGHDVFFPRSDRCSKAFAHHESSGTKLELERVNGVFGLPVELVPYSQSTSKNSTSGSYFSLSALEQIKDMMVRIMIVDHPNCPGRAMQ